MVAGVRSPDAQHSEKLLEQSRRERVTQRLRQTAESLEEWTDAERHLAEELRQQIAAYQAELEAARSAGSATLRDWVEERRAFKAELERVRGEWAKDASAQRLLTESLAQAVQTVRAEKQKALAQRSDLQAQLLELSVAHKKARSQAARLAEELRQVGGFNSERAATASALQSMTGRQESELAVLGAENTRLRAQMIDTEEEMDSLVSECSTLKSQLEQSRREVAALKTGSVVEVAEAKALRAMRSHNQSTSAEISKLLTRIANLEDRNSTLEWYEPELNCRDTAPLAMILLLLLTRLLHCRTTRQQARQLERGRQAGRGVGAGALADELDEANSLHVASLENALRREKETVRRLRITLREQAAEMKDALAAASRAKMRVSATEQSQLGSRGHGDTRCVTLPNLCYFRQS